MTKRASETNGQGRHRLDCSHSFLIYASYQLRSLIVVGYNPVYKICFISRDYLWSSWRVIFKPQAFYDEAAHCQRIWCLIQAITKDEVNKVNAVQHERKLLDTDTQSHSKRLCFHSGIEVYFIEYNLLVKYFAVEDVYSVILLYTFKIYFLSV